MAPAAAAFTIASGVAHRLRTVTMRDDLIGWVVSGEKRLIGAGCAGVDSTCRAGRVFLIARGTQWDVINDPAGHGRYVARVLSLSGDAVATFGEQHPQFVAIPPIQSCSGTPADAGFADVFERAALALTDDEVSNAIRQHRVTEVLLVLAERGLVFAPAGALGWIERVRRLVAQRAHADWTVERLASAFSVSASTLRRRLAEEGVAAADCVREVRMEVAIGLLQTSNLTVGEVAVRCGYESHSRFTAAFRERFGLTPSRLRG
jgi:AraC-like DNA-binding protein